jgi:uncharacterized membrane protein
VGQVNVNTPGGDGTSDGSGYGFIVGILVAIVVIALLVYFFVLNPGGGTNNTVNNVPNPSALLQHLSLM